MAKGRLIDNSIWDCDQFSTLNPSEQILFIALITCADDEGCFRADPTYWKKKVFYESRVGPLKVQRMIDRLREVGLIITGETEKGPAGFHPNFHEYQTLRSDRSKTSKYNEILVANGRTPRWLDAAEEKISEANTSQDKSGKEQEKTTPHRDVMMNSMNKKIEELAKDKGA